MFRTKKLILSVLLANSLAWSADVPHASAASLGSERPEHIALTWQRDPKTTQSITWRTAPGIKGTVVEIIPTSEYGGFPSSKARRVEGRSAAFASDAGDMMIHEAEITGLTPGVSYTYRVGSGSATGWSTAHRFSTEASGDAPVTFLFTTDTQALPNTGSVNGYGIWAELFRKAVGQYPDARFMLLSGDIVDYGDQQVQWENWFKAAEGTLPGINLVPTLGNHDALRTGEANFRAQFQLPQNGPEGEKELAYSFDAGNAHIAVLNSEGDLAKQAAWLRADMAASDKRWKIVAFHRSPYHSHQARASLDVRGAWTPVFDEAGVDLVLTGHDHAYMRSWSLKAGSRVADGKGTTYVIGGSAGPKFYDMGEYPWMRVKFDENIQLFSAVTYNAYQLTFKATARDGRSVDAFTLLKPVPGQRFADVFPSHWAYGIIDRLSREDTLSGTADGMFRPEEGTTRAAFASMLKKAFNLPEAGTSVYTDVLPGDWYYGAVAAVVNAGLAEGVSPRRFEPNRPITRQEMAVMLMKAYTLGSAVSSVSSPDPSALDRFTDATAVAVWATGPVGRVLELGLMSGRPGALFAPADLSTRAESAAALGNLVDRLASE